MAWGWRNAHGMTPANAKTEATAAKPLLAWIEDLSSDDVATVGGKNAGLGKMNGRLSGQGLRVPPGFADSASRIAPGLVARTSRRNDELRPSEVRSALVGLVRDVGRRDPASLVLVEDTAASLRALEAQKQLARDGKGALGAGGDLLAAVDANDELVQLLLSHGLSFGFCGPRK